MLRSDICDYSDAYIVVTGEVAVLKRVFTMVDFVALNNTQANVTATNTANNNNVIDGKLVFKKSAPFISCVSKINNVLIHNADDLDVFIPMYNLIEYRKSYLKTTRRLWKYYRDEPNNCAKNGINYSIRDSKSFDYKKKFIKSVTNANLTTQNVKIVTPLKHLSGFWKTDIQLINFELSLVLRWSENRVLTSKSTRDPNYENDPIVYKIDDPANAIFQITDTKLYVPVVTLSAKDDNKFLKQLKSGFKRTIKWNKYRSEMTKQTKTNNLKLFNRSDI